MPLVRLFLYEACGGIRYYNFVYERKNSRDSWQNNFFQTYMTSHLYVYAIYSIYNICAFKMVLLPFKVKSSYVCMYVCTCTCMCNIYIYTICTRICEQICQVFTSHTCSTNFDGYPLSNISITSNSFNPLLLLLFSLLDVCVCPLLGEV